MKNGIILIKEIVTKIFDKHAPKTKIQSGHIK